MTDSRLKKGNFLKDSWWSLVLIDLKLTSKERWPGKTLYAQNKVKIPFKGYDAELDE